MNRKTIAAFLFAVFMLFGVWANPSHGQEKIPDTFADITEVIPDVLLEIRNNIFDFSERFLNCIPVGSQ
jgi:hypothetical protein